MRFSQSFICSKAHSISVDFLFLYENLANSERKSRINNKADKSKKDSKEESKETILKKIEPESYIDLMRKLNTKSTNSNILTSVT